MSNLTGRQITLLVACALALVTVAVSSFLMNVMRS